MPTPHFRELGLRGVADTRYFTVLLWPGTPVLDRGTQSKSTAAETVAKYINNLSLLSFSS